jgi:hypothetical protein
MDPHSFSKPDPDPHSLKKLDPDPHKVNADPTQRFTQKKRRQSLLYLSIILCVDYLLLQLIHLH